MNLMNAGVNIYFIRTMPYYNKIFANKSIIYKIILFNVNPHAPVAQVVADEVVFRRFQGEGVEFL